MNRKLSQNIRRKIFSVFFVLILSIIKLSAAPGDVDLSFDAGAITHPSNSARVSAIVVQPDNKILIGGVFTSVNGAGRNFVARLNADGSLDNTFNAPLQTFGSNSGQVQAIALQSDGKIIVGGVFYVNNDIANVVRLNSNGSLDSTFSVVVTGTAVAAVVIQPDGKIIIGGNFGGVDSVSSPGIARLNANGSLDTALGAIAGTSVNVEAIALQADGKIVIGGGFTISGSNRARLTRLNTNGTQDASFNVGNGANGDVYALAIQPNNQILVGGFFTNISGTNRNAVARLNADGSVDAAFAPTLFAGSGIYSIVLQPNGKFFIAGTFGVVNGTVRARLARLNADGSLDAFYPTGTPSGANNTVWAAARQACGKFLIGGDFTSVAGVSHSRLARLVDTPRTFADFDGDGCADISVFRPSNGAWYLLRSSGGFTGQQWGANGDLLAPADFDADRRTDLAVFRNGFWYILRSSDNSFLSVAFGATGDLPRPGDFDGDGKADVSVFRPSNGTWYRLNSSKNQFVAVSFGASGDVPLLGDFDGDSKSDIAVFRPSSGGWFGLNSTNGALFAITFGASGDIPTMADFDGDEKADVSVFRPSGGIWYRLNSSNGLFVATVFGTNGDRPVPADYDSDGKADIVVFRPSSGAWYLLRSTGGFTAVSFGTNTDTPIPSAYLP